MPLREAEDLAVFVRTPEVLVPDQPDAALVIEPNTIAEPIAECLSRTDIERRAVRPLPDPV